MAPQDFSLELVEALGEYESKQSSIRKFWGATPTESMSLVDWYMNLEALGDRAKVDDYDIWNKFLEDAPEKIRLRRDLQTLTDRTLAFPRGREAKIFLKEMLGEDIIGMRVGPINKKTKGTVRDNVYHMAARVGEDTKNEDSKLGQTLYPIHSAQTQGQQFGPNPFMMVPQLQAAFQTAPPGPMQYAYYPPNGSNPQASMQQKHVQGGWRGKLKPEAVSGVPK